MSNLLHSEYDAIGEALDDAICSGDGRPTAKHLLVELAHRGMAIAPVKPTRAMLNAGWLEADRRIIECDDEGLIDIYQAMLSNFV